MWAGHLCVTESLLQWSEVLLCFLQVDVVCGDHLLDHYQSLKDIQSSVGEEALQVIHHKNTQYEQTTILMKGFL